MSQKIALIVDDEIDLINIYTEILSTIPYLKIITANDGMAAYRKARNQKFDFIITDYKMPKLNGVQLINALRDNNVNDQTPIVVISAFIDDVKEELVEAHLEKNITILSKPIDFNYILKLANEYIKDKDPAAKKSVDVGFLNTYLAAVQSVTKEMSQLLNVKSGKIEVTNNKIDLKCEISSYLSIVSPYFSGTLILTFPTETFLKLASKALDENFSNINDENKDFAGELSNIIFGKTKRLWTDKQFNFEKAIPLVQTSDKFSINSIDKTPTIVVPFESEVGPFYTVISIHWN